MMAYLIKATPDDNGTMLVTCPAFPEVTTHAAKEPKEVIAHALAAIEEAIAARIADALPLPPPATDAKRTKHKGLSVKLPLLIQLKAELYRQAPLKRSPAPNSLDASAGIANKSIACSASITPHASTRSKPPSPSSTETSICASARSHKLTFPAITAELASLKSFVIAQQRLANPPAPSAHAHAPSTSCRPITPSIGG